MAVILIRAARAEEEKERERAARKLQRIYRGHKGRKAYKKQQQKGSYCTKKAGKLGGMGCHKGSKDFSRKTGKTKI